jgi:hypothetical protein
VVRRGFCLNRFQWYSYDCEARDDLHLCADAEMAERTITSLSVPAPGKEGSAAAVAVFKLNNTPAEWDRYDLRT